MDRTGYTKTELVVIVLVLGFFFLLFMSALHSCEGAPRTYCINNQKQLILAMLNYESSHRVFPGANAAQPGRLSMFVDLLPYLEQQNLYQSLGVNLAEPAIVTLPNAPLSGNASAWTLNSKLPQCAPGGGMRNALSLHVSVFVCPADPSNDGMPAGLNYVPVVTASNPRWPHLGPLGPDGQQLEALWPASSEGTTGRILNPTAVPAYARRMAPPKFQRLRDGTSNTLALVERVKGAHVSGQRAPVNTAVYGAAAVGFLVGADGKIAAGDDNSASVARCVQAQQAGWSVPGPNHNDLSGAQWLQYTCAWMGCANTLGPPNSPVCSAGDTRAIAESGIAPPSSRHGGGATGVCFDGSVHFLSDKTDLRVMHALGTINGSERHVLDP